MRTMTLLANAKTPTDAQEALTTAQARGWSPTLIQRHASPAVRKLVAKPRTLAQKLERVVPASVPTTRKLSTRAKMRLHEAAKYPVGTRTGAELASQASEGYRSHGNARVEVEVIGPEGGLTVALESPEVGGYAKMSPTAFGELSRRGGVFTVHLCADRACTQRIGEFKLVKPVQA